MRFYQKAERLFERLEKANVVVGLAAGTCVLVLTGLIFVGAILRYAFASPIGQTLEISSMLFLLSGLLAMAYCLQAGGHINFSLVEDRLTGRAKRYLQLTSAIVSFGVEVLFTIGGWGIFWGALALGWKSPQMGLPLAFVQWALPVGFGLLSLEGLVLILRRLFAFTTARSEAKGKDGLGDVSI